MTNPTFPQLKRVFLSSGFEVRRMPRKRLESYALDAPIEPKRHMDSNIMGLLISDLQTIGIATDLTHSDAEETLLHELIHLYNEDMSEEAVESHTLTLAASLSPRDRGFLRFLIS
jgi:hypothetical protein